MLANDSTAPDGVGLGERLAQGKGYRLHLERVIANPLDPAALNRAVERVVGRCPAQYLWGYNRYKVPAGAEPPPVAAA